MTCDGMTGVEIEYNILNLPSRIYKGSEEINYIYSADGTKLASTVGSSSTYYRSVMVYAAQAGGSEQLLHILHPEGLIAKGAGNTYTYKYFLTDHLGSTRVVLAAIAGRTVVEQTTDYYPYGLAWDVNNLHLNRYLFGGKELQDASIGGVLLGLYDFHARFYHPILGRWFNVDPALQLTNPYVYCANNPGLYVDPDGEFITWSFGRNGFSIGFNFGFFGFGINIGWRNGGSIGVYGELGPRVGGTGFGAGATTSISFDFGFQSGQVATTTGVGVYGSLGMFNAGANVSYNYNERAFGWGVSGGVNILGNDARGVGLNFGYGSGGWDYGVGGYYNPHAWDSNPIYDPDHWAQQSEVGDLTYINNCYTYALDMDGTDAVWLGEKGGGWSRDVGGFNPGSKNGHQRLDPNDVNLNHLTNLAVSDGKVKRLNFWNKLGFGKKGYYSAYLVTDNGVDYHWYRQDKGGNWSHKQGWMGTRPTNADASGRLITNPARANRNYGIPNYNKGIFLWIKK